MKEQGNVMKRKCECGSKLFHDTLKKVWICFSCGRRYHGQAYQNFTWKERKKMEIEDGINCYHSNYKEELELHKCVESIIEFERETTQAIVQPENKVCVWCGGSFSAYKNVCDWCERMQNK